MSYTFQETSLRDALELHCSELGNYTFEAPPSLCFATVAVGGLIQSVVHKAAVDFVLKSSISNTHQVSCLCTRSSSGQLFRLQSKLLSKFE